MQMVLPEYELPMRLVKVGRSPFSSQEREEVFDPLRRRWVRLTPEEGVRQRLIRWLVDGCAYPAGRIAVETGIEVNGMKKRCDAVVYDEATRPLVIVECKAPKVRITQDVFDQAAVYNSVLKVPYLLMSNGLTHFFCRVDKGNRKYVQFEAFPRYEALLPELREI